jgi:hypothetical protein
MSVEHIIEEIHFTNVGKIGCFCKLEQKKISKNGVAYLQLNNANCRSIDFSSLTENQNKRSENFCRYFHAEI